MSPVLLLGSPQRWWCPNCQATDITRPHLPGETRYHNCPGLHGLSAPLIREGDRVAVLAEERQDYLNGDTQATGTDGKAYMAVRTQYWDGHDDLAVNAGLATARLS